MGLGRAEEHAVGHDDGGAAAGLEQAQEERAEEQLGLLGLDDLLKVLGGGLVVEAASEGRIGEDEGVLLRIVVVGFSQLEGLTPLMIAACLGRRDVARALRAAGASAALTSRNGFAAADWGRQFGQPLDFVEELR